MSVSDKKASSSKKETSKVISACLRCKQDVRSNEEAVSCETCDNWFYIQCEDVSPDQYKLMQKEESKNLHWFCKDCEDTTLSTNVT